MSLKVEWKIKKDVLNRVREFYALYFRAEERLMRIWLFFIVRIRHARIEITTDAIRMLRFFQ